MGLSIYFPFTNWLGMIKTWDALLPVHGDDLYLVVSTNFYTSGYWIETGLVTFTENAVFYKTDEEVKALIGRVKHNEFLKANTKGKSGLIL